MGVTHHRALWSPDFPPRHVPSQSELPIDCSLGAQRLSASLKWTRPGAAAIIAPATNSHVYHTRHPTDQQASWSVSKRYLFQKDGLQPKRFEEGWQGKCVGNSSILGFTDVCASSRRRVKRDTDGLRRLFQSGIERGQRQAAADRCVQVCRIISRKLVSSR